MTPPLDERGDRVVQLVPLLKLGHLGDRRFDYVVPPELEDRVRLGSVVMVPFGHRVVRAIVVDTIGSVEGQVRDLRCIESASDEAVPEELLELAQALAIRYLSSYESCLRLVVPAWLASLGRGAESRGGASLAGRWVMKTVGADVLSFDKREFGRLTRKQQMLMDAVPSDGVPLRGLCERVGVSRGVLRTLVEKGLLELRAAPEEDEAHTTGAERLSEARDPERSALWPEQVRAIRELLAAYEEPGLSRRLLWGVTGSGKTEVYLQVLEQVLSEGAGAILLVPEIALTPLMIDRVRARFGARVGVVHSGLPRGERVREYRRIAAGDASVVVGARSAIFAPVQKLRLIIIDEAHDSSYKQDEAPRYQTATVAEMRLEREGGLLVEGSATPSMEHMLEPKTHLRLTHRAAGAQPDCEVVDMRHQGAGLLLAPRSREALAETLRLGDQAIVLLNRRGYAAHVHCGECGHVMMCEECELSLTYHAQARRLLCHHCGRVYRQPPLCPSCGLAPLVRAAPGTERLDQELRALAPREQVFRIDSDVITSGSRVQSILSTFAESRPGILVGTQMVAKGHDFPRVTLVVVADADTGLYLPDFRASERTFQLLMQVAGRAGRAEKPGRVLVQTWNPDVPCIRMALQRDEEGFYQEELRTRERLGYPPFAELIRLIMIAGDAERARVAAHYLGEQLVSYFSAKEVRGPARLPTLRGRQRWHVLIASHDGERARAIVGRALEQLREPYRRRGVTLLVDVDPLSFG